MANNNSIGTVPFSGTSRTPLPRSESRGLATLGKKVNKIARGVLGPATDSVKGLATLVNPNDIYEGLVKSGENLKQGSLEADPLKLLLGAMGTATVAAENTPVGKAVKTPIKWYRGSNNPNELKGIFKAEKEGVVGGGGIYVTPNTTYAETYSKYDVTGNPKKGGFVSELDIEMKNPLIVDTVSKGKPPEVVVLEALGIKTDKAIDIVEKAVEDQGGLTNQVKSKAIKQGYDGIVLKKDGAIQEALVYNTKSVKNKNLKESGSSSSANESENISIFPKPERMFPEGERPKGGEYLNPQTGDVLTDKNLASATISITPQGKPKFNASSSEKEIVGSPSTKGATKIKTNLFRKSAGWKWLSGPKEYKDIPTLVSVENKGKHYYALEANFPEGVNLTRYSNSSSEPRLRPTVKGFVNLGKEIGKISVRGKEHPVYNKIVSKYAGGSIVERNPYNYTAKAI